MTNQFVTLPSKIRKNLNLSASKIYVIKGEVRVLKNVKVTARNGVRILLVNGVFKSSRLKRSALIFDQGSRLSAKKMHLMAANELLKPVKLADNGGIWFLGNYANASKDGLHLKTNRKNPLSHFSAQLITTNYLGRADSYISPKSGNLIGIGDDIDGFSVLGVGPTEWSIKSIKCNHSADDGIDFANSHVQIMNLEILNPIEDCINASSSRIEIHRSLKLDASKTKNIDRDLFDLETIDGASYIELHPGCSVKLKGVFGDQLVLSSPEMPRPNTRTDNEREYFFSGKIKRAALIYSINED
ncbi:hypothetical protein AOC19_04220 [Polynucleobacter asymbioticus]|uniref:hypothetical protein n=1 Tax=Polynucleobacter asymbioticus TaxID=576611 RepID=UPI001BFDDE6B|nr:hypothetical protein [Polynucleobacter asymbioticus]QWD86071.1 hypothetical protein AOC19_04220 [Polynucleobacter asymbioticus]